MIKINSKVGLSIGIVILLFLITTGCKPRSWQYGKSLDGFYDQMANKIKTDKHLIISIYAGLWTDGRPPESNFHWGSKYGIFSMFNRSQNDPLIRQVYTNYRWRRIHLVENPNDPIRVAVFENEIEPNTFWKSKGILAPFKVYAVFLAYEDLIQAGEDLADNVGDAQAITVSLNNGFNLDLSESIMAGYNGHNYYYDIAFRLRSWGKIPKLKKIPKEEKGVFIICCHSKTEYRSDFIDENVYALGFTTSRMAPEGYNLLAMFDGITQGLDGKVLKKKMDESYRYFQVHGGNSPPGPLFVNHETGLF